MDEEKAMEKMAELLDSCMRRDEANQRCLDESKACSLGKRFVFCTDCWKHEICGKYKAYDDASKRFVGEIVTMYEWMKANRPVLFDGKLVNHHASLEKKGTT